MKKTLLSANASSSSKVEKAVRSAPGHEQELAVIAAEIAVVRRLHLGRRAAAAAAAQRAADLADHLVLHGVGEGDALEDRAIAGKRVEEGLGEDRMGVAR